MKLDDLKNLKLTKEQQQALAFAVMILGGGSYGYYNFLFKPRVAKIATLKKELKEEKKLLEEMRASVRKIDEFKRNAERVARNLRVIKKRLPDEERVPEVMKGINKAVKMSGVALIGKFKPPSPMGRSASPNYRTLTTEILVVTSYRGLASLITELMRIPRVISVDTVDLSRNTDASTPGSLKAKMKLTSYIYTPTVKKTKKKKKKRRK